MPGKKSVKRAAGGGRNKKRGGSGSDRGERGGGRWRKKARRSCYFCENKIEYIDYKDMAVLERNVSRDRGKILPKRKTANCARHQRRVTVAVKRARHMALLPFCKD